MKEKKIGHAPSLKEQKSTIPLCLKCGINVVLHKKLCSKCYYKERRISAPEKTRIKNRKAYWKRKGYNIEHWPNPEFKRFTPIKSRKYRNAERLLTISLATPKWINKKELIEKLSNCPKGLSIDHVIPLSGKNVCGLNVPWNIEYISLEQNRRKKNKYASS